MSILRSGNFKEKREWKPVRWFTGEIRSTVCFLYSEYKLAIYSTMSNGQNYYEDYNFLLTLLSYCFLMDNPLDIFNLSVSEM